MVDATIINYVRQELNEGFTNDQIASALRMQGYNESEITEALRLGARAPARQISGMPKGVSLSNLLYHRNLIIGVAIVLVVAVVGIVIFARLTSGPSVPISPATPIVPDGGGGNTADSGGVTITGDQEPVVEQPTSLYGEYDPNLDFAIVELDVSDFIDDQYNFVPKEEFSLGDDVYLYLNVQGFKYEPREDGRFRRNLYEGIQTKRNGEIVSLMTKQELFDSRVTDIVEGYERDNELEFKNTLPGRLFEPGEYDITIYMNDDITGEQVERTVRFTVR